MLPTLSGVALRLQILRVDGVEGVGLRFLQLLELLSKSILPERVGFVIYAPHAGAARLHRMRGCVDFRLVQSLDSSESWGGNNS